MVSTREIVLELLREVLKPQFLLGAVCSFSVFVTFVPLYCPCGGYQRWVNPLSLTGFVMWIASSLIGVLSAESGEQRSIYIFSLIAAPLAYLFMFSAFVSH